MSTLVEDYDDFRLREYLCLQLRSGCVCRDFFSIKPPTYNVVSEAYFTYKNSFDELSSKSIMTIDGMYKWMLNNGLWSESLEQSIKDKKKILEKTKIQIYKDRSDTKKVAHHTLKIKFLDNEIQELLSKKNIFYTQTCEYLAENDRLNHILKSTCTHKGKTIKNNQLEKVKDIYYSSIISEHKIRELALNDPWYTLWHSSKSCNFQIFTNAKDEDFTINQKNIMSWSCTFDILRESPEPPPKEAWSDQNIMDGFILFQNEQNKTKDAQKKIEQSMQSPNIKKAGTRFAFARSGITSEDIYGSNSEEGKKIIREMEANAKSGSNIIFSELPHVKQREVEAQMNALRKSRRK